jgi:arylsulfatase A-like enzyme
MHATIYRMAVIAALLGLLLPGAASAGPRQARQQPNLIVIVTDDQARWSLGAYGNKESRTPNMDRLARQGATFLNAFCATPVCSPSRASLLTGRYGTQVGITDWITPKQAEGGSGLPREALTWMLVLQRAGYHTGLVGKWHLGTLPAYHPSKHGFAHFMGFLGGGNSPMNPTLQVNGQTKKLKGSLPDLLTDDAIDFVTRNRAGPFALMLNFRAPHLPYGPVPPADTVPFKDLDPTIPDFPGLDVAQVKKWTRDYYASVHSVDRNLGRLLQLLDDLELSENTIIIFTSDHGYMIGHHGLHAKGNAVWVAGAHKGKQRPNMFDDSLRVPLIVRWPRVVKGGTQVPELVSNIDTFASVLGMLEVPPPADYRQEGKDFSPLLRGRKAAWRDAVFAQYDLHNGGKASMRSIRTARWHLVRQYLGGQADELFDLQNDPGETRNRYDDAKLRATRDDLQYRLDTWMQSIDDPLLKRK